MTTTRQYPILINCRDRVADLRRLVEWLERAGQHRILFIDNDSTYPPLLDFYRRSPYEVVRLGHNLGHMAPWTSGLAALIARGEPYVVTDPDVVPSEECPLDALTHFHSILERYPAAPKVGFGLKVDDLPDHYEHKDRVHRWESQFWQDLAEPGVYRAKLDTTFALYRPSARPGIDGALRTGPPYVARHMPWYEDSQSLSEETRYYRSRAAPGVTTWSGKELPAWLAK